MQHTDKLLKSITKCTTKWKTNVGHWLYANVTLLLQTTLEKANCTLYNGNNEKEICVVQLELPTFSLPNAIIMVRNSLKNFILVHRAKHSSYQTGKTNEAKSVFGEHLTALQSILVNTLHTHTRQGKQCSKSVFGKHFRALHSILVNITTHSYQTGKTMKQSLYLVNT